MFPAVLSTKLEAAIQREEKRKRRAVQAERSSNKNVADNKGKRASEFEALLNEYSKMEADEIAVRGIDRHPLVLCSLLAADGMLLVEARCLGEDIFTIQVAKKTK